MQPLDLILIIGAVGVMSQSIEALLERLNPQIVGSLKRAIELGKWPNGIAISPEQRALCGEAVARWEHRHLLAESRVGFVPPKTTPCADDHDHSEQQLTWVDS
jgi:uncharacterized protein